MAEGKQIALAIILELIGSIMLGMGQAVLRQSATLLIFFPAWSWFCYVS